MRMRNGGGLPMRNRPLASMRPPQITRFLRRPGIANRILHNTLRAARRWRRKIERSFAIGWNVARSFGCPQAIPDTVNGLDEFRISILCDFLTQPIDVDLHKIGFRIEVGVPDMLDDLAERHNLRR